MNTWNKEYVVRLIYSHLKTHKHSPTKGNCCLMYFAPRFTLLPSSVLKKCAIVSRSETNCRYYKCTGRPTNFMDNTALQLSHCLFRETGLACHLAFIPGGLSKYLDRGVRMRDKNPYPILDHNQLDVPTLSSTPEDKNPLSFISSIRSDEGLTLETSAFESLYES